MRIMGSFLKTDGLSQALLRLTVTSTVYCLSEMSSPWGFRVAARPDPAFHLLTSGTAWLEVDGEPEAVRVQAGDLIVLPRGNGHQLRDARDSPVHWLDNILNQTPPVNGRLRHGGGGERAELICGGFAIDQLTARPLIEGLSTIVHLRAHDGLAPEWLSGLIRMISVEMATTGPGSEAVVSRLTDALLAQALRAYLVQTDGEGGGPVSDPLIARALRLIRERPSEKWSVSKMAAAVGLSRSAFAERFRAATGEPPIQSLTRYRLSRAANYLRTTSAGVREIARRTGYDSEVTISKAFRRHYGTSPGAYRKTGNADQDLGRSVR